MGGADRTYIRACSWSDGRRSSGPERNGNVDHGWRAGADPRSSGSSTLSRRCIPDCVCVGRKYQYLSDRSSGLDRRCNLSGYRPCGCNPGGTLCGCTYDHCNFCIWSGDSRNCNLSSASGDGRCDPYRTVRGHLYYRYSCTAPARIEKTEEEKSAESSGDQERKVHCKRGGESPCHDG